uniref:Dynein light chain n=1 Tax=Fibrocapsa japonica TaxID=94617 RepID=A0A7S2UW34_9STRA|mmetsp:Transcript_1638/g.2266  ORF Transcript_1638/g.2266 Transcript_1638/m.2266 type:complete len:106 (+) Transcript_1638:44-361(+)
MADSDDEQPQYKLSRKVVILRAEFPEVKGEDLQEDAIRKVDESLTKHTISKDVATEVKRHFDEKYGGTWHCVVGRNFGCSVTNETRYLLFFKIEQTFVLLFKSQE